jgi:hypothetical protein
MPVEKIPAETSARLRHERGGFFVSPRHMFLHRREERTWPII